MPDDRTLLIERTKDDLGDWRVLVLSSLGSRVHAPWAMAVTARLREELGVDVETMWGDDGFVVRLPGMDRPPDPSLMLPDPDEVEGQILRQLGSTALFSARFREARGRALLLPRRRPGARRRSGSSASARRPAVGRGALRLVSDHPRDLPRVPARHLRPAGARRRAAPIRSRSIRVATIESQTPSPFAASLSVQLRRQLHLRRRRAAGGTAGAGAVGGSGAAARAHRRGRAARPARRAAIESVEAELQLLPERFHARSSDGVHDLLLRSGDLTRAKSRARAPGLAKAAVPELLRGAPGHRAADRRRAAARRVEHAARYRDALGAPLPPGLPAALLEPSADALGDLVSVYARTHGPFTAGDLAMRFGLPVGPIEAALARLTSTGRVIEGAFRPGGRGREWCEDEVLRTIRQRSLARLRQEVEPVEPPCSGAFSRLARHRRARGGLDALLDTIEQLQGVPLVASLLEHEILPARVADYTPSQLDTLLGAGEVSWVASSRSGKRDGRIALYLTDHMPRLLPPPSARPAELVGKRRSSQRLHDPGASFFAALHASMGGGFPKETVDALWSLVWKGRVTNDTLHALRRTASARTSAPPRRATPFRSRRLVPPSAEGRWSVAPLPRAVADRVGAAFAQQLLTRHGVVTREVTSVEQLPGGFSAVYPVLRRMEETGACAAATSSPDSERHSCAARRDRSPCGGA